MSAVSDLRLLLFDLDGTLVDSFADIRHGIAHALEAIDAEPTDELLALCRLGVSLEVFYRRAVGEDPEAPSERDRMQRFVDAYRHHYIVHQENTRPYGGVCETLRWIRAERPDVFLAVATAKRSDMARAVTDRFGLSPLLHLVQGSEGLPKKPDPALLERISARAEIPLERAAMVGDTDLDVLAAWAAGCRSVAVTYGGWSRAALERLGPDHLIDHFGELRGLLLEG